MVERGFYVAVLRIEYSTLERPYKTAVGGAFNKSNKAIYDSCSELATKKFGSLDLHLEYWF